MMLTCRKTEELYVMKVEYGQIKEYKTKKGYGFVTRTFDNTIRQNIKDRDVFFHITSIKDDFPDLAQQREHPTF